MVESVCVVVVTHNSTEQMPSLMSALGEGNNPGSAVWVVDSGSDPQHWPRDSAAQRVVLAANYGYGSSVNIAARAGLNADWVAVMNPDARVSLADLENMATNATIAGVDVTAPVVNLPDHAGGHFTSVPTPPWRRRQQTFETLGDHFHRVEALQGSIFLVRSDVFKALNGFDERFFLYFEEIDLCTRAKNAGYTVAYNSQTVGSHSGEQSSVEVSAAWRTTERIRGKLTYMRIHYGPVAATFSLFRELIKARPLMRVVAGLARNPRRGLPFPARPLASNLTWT